MTFRKGVNEMKETPKTQQVSLVKKNRREASEKKCKITRVFFFSFKIPLQRKSHNGGGKLRHKREISLQTTTKTTTRKERTKERREQNARKSWHTGWPPLSPPLRFPFGRRQSRSVEEGGGGAKEAPIIIR